MPNNPYEFQPMGSYKAYRDPLPRKVAQLFSDLAEYRAKNSGQYQYPGSEDPRNFNQGTYFDELQALQDYYYNLTPQEQNKMLLSDPESFGKLYFGPQEFQNFLQSKAPIRPETPTQMAPPPQSYEEAQSLIGQGTFNGQPIAYGRGMGSTQRLAGMGLDLFPAGGVPSPAGDINNRLNTLLQAQEKRQQDKQARQNEFLRGEAAKTAEKPLEEQRLYQEGSVYIPPEKTPQGYAADVEAEALGLKRKEKSLLDALKTDQKQQDIVANTNAAIDNAAADVMTFTTGKMKMDFLKSVKDLYGKDVDLSAVQAAVDKMVKDYKAAEAKNRGATITVNGANYHIQGATMPETTGAGSSSLSVEDSVAQALQRPGMTEQDIRNANPDDIEEEVIKKLKEKGYKFGIAPVSAAGNYEYNP